MTSSNHSQPTSPEPEAMNRCLLPLLLTLAASASSAAPSVRLHTVHYVCQERQKLDVTYMQTGPGPSSPGFVLLKYQGQPYGLAQAISASGARYASLYGPTPAGHGLEWWEHGGEGTLSQFTGKTFFETAPLLRRCKPA
jgi:membrane-bound inhibitor of C-type lysozyme